jgi:hypothetical protein
MGGIGSSSARVATGQVTNYVRKGAAKLVLRDPMRANDGNGNHGGGGGGGGGGQSEAAEASGAGGDFDNEVLNLQHLDREVGGEPEFIIHRRTRSSVNKRERRATNWQRAEAILADVMLKDGFPDPCACDRREVVTVRCVDLNSYEHREFQYCNCPQSPSCLLKEGYFPCSPIKPKTAFSIRLLQLLHEQSVLGYVSRSAWSGGLRALFEGEKKTALPAFDREVSTPLHHSVPLNTERV